MKIVAQSDRVTVWLYEPIENGFAKRLRDEIGGAVRLIELRINSPGGVVAEAAAAFSLLKSHAARVEAIIDGVAASSASFLAMAADRISMSQSALMMIHRPWMSTTGDARELRKSADALDKHAEVLLAAYARAGVPRAELERMLDAETWLTAQEARELGFIDAIHDGEPFAACAHRTLFQLPERLLNMNTQTTPTAQAIDAKTRDAVLAADTARRSEIAALFAPALDKGMEGADRLMAQCQNDVNCTPRDASDKLLNLYAQATPTMVWTSAVSVDDRDRISDFKAAFADAVLARNGVKVPAPHPATRDFMSVSVLDAARSLLSMRGTGTAGMSPAATIKAAMSGSDLPLLLENVANKSMMVGFESAEAATHRAWTRQGTLTDFREASRVALSETPDLDLVPELGEYKSGALSDAKETIRLETFGKVISLSRQALVNDELGALARVPTALGQSAARKEADLVYGLLTGNPTMRDGKALFHATHGNIGTPGALSAATLGEARKLMRLQKGLGGKAVLNITPRFLIVSAALEQTAEQLVAQIQPATVGDAVPGWIKQLQVVVDPRLDAVSATAWYLAASPDQHDTIEVARLDGNGATVEQEQDFYSDATSFKVRLDVGAAVPDWRGLVYNAGA